MKRKLMILMGMLALLATPAAFADPGQNNGQGPNSATYSTQTDPAKPCTTC